MPHGVLDVVAENPQEDHVSQDMQPPGVQEHRGYQGNEKGMWGTRVEIVSAVSRVLARHQRVLKDVGGHAGLALREVRELCEEDREVDQDDPDIHPREDVIRLARIGKRDQGVASSAS